MGVDCASRKSGIAVVEGSKLLYHEAYNSSLRSGWSPAELAAELNKFRKRIYNLAREYSVDIVVVELTGGFRNPQTTRMLSYFEGAALMGAKSSRKIVHRAPTVSARAKALGKKYTEKKKAIAKARSLYPTQKLTEDEAEAIIFARYGLSLLS